MTSQHYAISWCSTFHQDVCAVQVAEGEEQDLLHSAQVQLHPALAAALAAPVCSIEKASCISLLSWHEQGFA